MQGSIASYKTYSRIPHPILHDGKDILNISKISGYQGSLYSVRMSDTRGPANFNESLDLEVPWRLAAKPALQSFGSTGNITNCVFGLGVLRLKHCEIAQSIRSL